MGENISSLSDEISWSRDHIPEVYAQDMQGTLEEF
jgi:hypothetical protein